MNTTVINIKTDKILKKDAQRLAKNFGLPLSTVINTYLREFVREKRIIFFRAAGAKRENKKNFRSSSQRHKRKQKSRRTV